jgi:hypothetical protein
MLNANQSTISNDKGVTHFLIVAIGLYIVDFMITKFNGINMISLFNVLTVEKILRITGGSMFLLIMMLYILSQKTWNSDTVKNVITFGLLTLFINIIILFGGITLGNLLHIGMAMWVYYGILKPQNQEMVWVANLQIIGLMILDFFLLSFLYDQGIKLKLLPVWFFGVYFFSRDLKQSKFDGFLVLSVSVFIMFAFTSQAMGFTNLSQTMDPSITSDFQNMISEFRNNFINFFFGLETAAIRIYNQTTAVYQESYYTGEIDSNAQKELGVFIKDIELAQPDYYYDEPISIWGTLVVKTLENPITVQTECISELNRDEEYRADKIHPESFTAVQFDSRPIDCVFNKYSFRPGSYSMTIKTTFDFQTYAYQKKYFINKDRANSLLRQKIDPLTNYGINDPQPSAIYTAGPLMVGMSTENSLIKIDTEDSEEEIVYVGITLSNMWEGTINEINRLVITVPEYMALVDGECSGREFEQLADNSKGISYMLKDPIKDITDYKTIRCPLKITSKTGILGQAPLAIRYIKIETNYSYTIKKGKSITVRSNEKLEDLYTLTKASDPVISIPKQEMEKDQNITLSLFEYVYDAETNPKTLLKFNLRKSFNESIISCNKYERFFIKCKSFNNSGSTFVEVEVNDLVKSKTAKFEICVDEGCKVVENKTEENKTEQNQTEQDSKNGPILLKEIPMHIFTSENYDPYQIFVGSYIKDGDDKTPIIDFDYTFPVDNYIKAYTTKIGNSAWILFETNTKECIENHPYSFSIKDSDKNTLSITVLFNIEGCSD